MVTKLLLLVIHNLQHYYKQRNFRSFVDLAENLTVTLSTSLRLKLISCANFCRTVNFDHDKVNRVSLRFHILNLQALINGCQ